MDRASLEQLLGRGLSLAEIGRRFELAGKLGLSTAAVRHWLDKYKLRTHRAAGLRLT